ncbi:MAG: hypothetical protein ACOY94_25915 [Bacillota bacterium]
MRLAFQVQNTGSLDAQLKQLSATVTGDQALAEVVEVKVCEVPDCSVNVFYDGTLWALAQTPQNFAPPVVLYAGNLFDDGDLITLFFVVTVPLSANDTLQGMTVQAAFQVYAEQLRNNP